MRFPFDNGMRLTSPYGERELAGTSGFHGGIDLVGLDSYEVKAVLGGIVAESAIVTDESDPTSMWGNYIIIAAEDGTVHFYFHLKSRSVKRYDRVKEGDLLGIMGNTGYSFGDHLHFEVRKSDAATKINAASYLSIENEEGIYYPDMASLWAYEATEFAKSEGLFLGDGNGRYRWQDNVTREELAAVLMRFYNILNKRKELK